MHYFNFKTLAFYSVVVSSVLVLFNIVTAYGESHLKAPPAINGIYRLDLSEKLPICESDVLMLDIQQSGIYLNGFVSPMNAKAEVSTAAETNLNLIGKLNQKQLNLSGKVTQSALCQTPGSQTQANTRLQENAQIAIAIHSQLVDTRLMGQLKLNEYRAITFTAIQQKSPEKSEGQLHSKI